MGTKNKPGSWDCYANAEPDEPMFVLRARDEKAPGLVRQWVRTRQIFRMKQVGMRMGSVEPDAKEREALRCADAMEEWRAKRERAE
jgi:hypothetical protein